MDPGSRRIGIPLEWRFCEYIHPDTTRNYRRSPLLRRTRFEMPLQAEALTQTSLDAEVALEALIRISTPRPCTGSSSGARQQRCASPSAKNTPFFQEETPIVANDLRISSASGKRCIYMLVCINCQILRRPRQTAPTSVDHVSPSRDGCRSAAMT